MCSKRFFCSASERAHFRALENSKVGRVGEVIMVENIYDSFDDLSLKFDTFRHLYFFFPVSFFFRFIRIVYTQFCRELNRESCKKKFDPIVSKLKELLRKQKILI